MSIFLFFYFSFYVLISNYVFINVQNILFFYKNLW